MKRITFYGILQQDDFSVEFKIIWQVVKIVDGIYIHISLKEDIAYFLISLTSNSISHTEIYYSHETTFQFWSMLYHLAKFLDAIEIPVLSSMNSAAWHWSLLVYSNIPPKLNS